MKHKLQAIFERVLPWFPTNCNPDNDTVVPYVSHIVWEDISRVMVTITPIYSSFMEYKLSYIVVDIRDICNDEFIMSFSINSAGGSIVKEECEVERIKYPQIKAVEKLLEHFGLATKFRQPISVRELPSFPENSNPYHHDRDRMGMSIVDGLEVMFNSNSNGGIPIELILINTKTGKRFELDIREALTDIT